VGDEPRHEHEVYRSIADHLVGDIDVSALGIPRLGTHAANVRLRELPRNQRETARAEELVDEALSIYVAENDEWGRGQCHIYLGIIAETSATDPRGATSHYRKAIDLLRPFEDATLLPVALIGQAGVLGRRDPAGALKVAAAASAIRERIGGKLIGGNAKLRLSSRKG
jgi:hypothetical protein